MGGSESSLYPNHGYRVLNIQENSPISHTNIHEMVDFLWYDPESVHDPTFSEILQKHENETIEITVYNMINREKRQVEICPNKNWGGDSLLGWSLRFEDYKDAHLKVFYVCK